MQKNLVLVFNCGSSSIKFAIVDPVSTKTEAKGLVECIGKGDARIKWEIGAQKETKDLPNVKYQAALNFILEILQQQPELFSNIVAIGHRVVHGGESFTESVVIDDVVLDAIEACQDLAPLHNPANMAGIMAARLALPDLPQVAVFDTAFHQTMPDYAYLYAIPYKLYSEHKIRRYGFHGTSHRFVAQQAAEILNKPLEKCNLITAHLGNGCSVCAISNGKSVDTSMGLTPLEGLMMGTRSGDIDPSIHLHLVDSLGYDISEVNELLNKQSGLLGVSELDSDMRTLEAEALNGNKQAQLALDIFCYRLAKYIGAYAIVLGSIDALIFTGGIGENSDVVRRKVLQLLSILGFDLDDAKNIENCRGKEGLITTAKSTKAIVISTNEELMIAKDALVLTE